MGELSEPGWLGLVLEYAKARRLLPAGFSDLVVVPVVVNCVQPVHLAVTCQCVPLLLVPVLRSCTEAPVYTAGAVRVL